MTNQMITKAQMLLAVAAVALSLTACEELQGGSGAASRTAEGLEVRTDAVSLCVPLEYLTIYTSCSVVRTDPTNPSRKAMVCQVPDLTTAAHMANDLNIYLAQYGATGAGQQRVKAYSQFISPAISAFPEHTGAQNTGLWIYNYDPALVTFTGKCN